jgi:hypothetical protein
MQGRITRQLALGATWAAGAIAATSIGWAAVGAVQRNVTAAPVVQKQNDVDSVTTTTSVKGDDVVVRATSTSQSLLDAPVSSAQDIADATAAVGRAASSTLASRNTVGSTTQPTRRQRSNASVATQSQLQSRVTTAAAPRARPAASIAPTVSPSVSPPVNPAPTAVAVPSIDAEPDSPPAQPAPTSVPTPSDLAAVPTVAVVPTVAAVPTVALVPTVATAAPVAPVPPVATVASAINADIGGGFPPQSSGVSAKSSKLAGTALGSALFACEGNNVWVESAIPLPNVRVEADVLAFRVIVRFTTDTSFATATASCSNGQISVNIIERISPV